MYHGKHIWSIPSYPLAGEDYGRVASQTLIFGPTDQSQTLRIPLIDNSIHEATEQFTVRFEVVSERGVAVTHSEATVSIVDDDDCK